MLSRIVERFVVQSYLYPAFSLPSPILTFADQFAFRPTGSTTAALIALYQQISDFLVNEPYVRVVVLDFSKAFDTVRHSALIGKVNSLGLHTSISGWIDDFLSQRSHVTSFCGTTSPPLPITASVVQGSALGPSLYAITAADLKTLDGKNRLTKFADDTYLLVPASNIDTTDKELEHIEAWASANNLKLNKDKSRELIFTVSKRSKAEAVPPIMGIERVSSLKCLGITLSTNFTFAEHIDTTVSSCSSNLFALKVLKTKGLPPKQIYKVFNATVLSKLVYASQFWWGFTSASDRDRLEAVVRRAIKSDLCSPDVSIPDRCCSADEKLLNKVLCNPRHVLYQFIPPRRVSCYSTRSKGTLRDFILPTKTSLRAKLFPTRLLYPLSY